MNAVDYEKIVICLYKEQYYIFGVCPCCKKIFQLTDCVVNIPSGKITFKQLHDITKEREKLEKKRDAFDTGEYKYYENNEKYQSSLSEFKTGDKIVEKRIRKSGRKLALKKISKIDKVFSQKNIDPIDTRLIFSPVEFVVFNGMTENKNIDSLLFLGKHPESGSQEKILNSIGKVIKNGNLEFTQIRIDENGKVTYT